MPNVDVAITGVGLVTPLGTSTAENITAWKSNGPFTSRRLPELTDTPLENVQTAVTNTTGLAERINAGRMRKYMSQSTLLGCAAAAEAIKMSGINSRVAPEKIGLYAGSGQVGIDLREIEELVTRSIDDDGQFSCSQMGTDGLAATNPLLSFKILPNMPACLISILCNIKGPNLIFTPWEGQSAAAIREAMRAVSERRVEAAVTGASDSPAMLSTLLHLRSAEYINHDDIAADAAAYMVLESVDAARRSGTRVMGILKDVMIQSQTDRPCDPLAVRMGRTFAAAPAIILGLHACGIKTTSNLVGVDRKHISFDLEPCA